MQDPSTVAEEDDDDDVDMLDMNDMYNYDAADSPLGEDSDKLKSDSDECQEVAALAATTSQVSSSNVQSIRPNKKVFKRAAKPKILSTAIKIERINKSKSKQSHVSHDEDDMDIKLTNSLEKIEHALAKPSCTSTRP